jgi:hypothetical protein
MQSSTRRTQPRRLTGLAGDDGDAHRVGAAGGAAATPASLCRRFKAGERPQAAPQAFSPPREAPRRIHDSCEAAAARIDGGAARLGFEGRAAARCCG